MKRVLAAGALAVPLTLGIAGFASADPAPAYFGAGDQASAQVSSNVSVNGGYASADVSAHASVQVREREGWFWDHDHGYYVRHTGEIRWYYFGGVWHYDDLDCLYDWYEA